MAECLFCNIVAGTVPSTTVYADDDVVVIEDVHPQAPVHVLLIPRAHVRGVGDLTDAHRTVVGRVLQVAHAMAVKKGIADSGYRIVVNTNADAGQSVFHIHFHLLGGRRMAWPPG